MPPHGSSPRRESSRRYYEKHRKEVLAKRKVARDSGHIASVKKVRVAENRKRAQDLKRVPCLDCGREYPPYVMDYDHVRGTKLTNIARLTSQDTSWQSIAKEIAKCEIVCSNCHRERTHRRKM